ncbi:MAG TPA: SGNH/GDSL hydrolase family protein [Verrucomicrobiae bacterium]|jgi:lysophospholipase L1-like esterase|nr:SGNH/GDSL hydrolase family protein [Verrucomicrobiae bacterium]
MIMIPLRIAAWLIAAASLCPPGLRAQPSTDPASAQVELQKGDRIIFFGDSLTALAVKDTHVPDGKGYVPLVREALKDRGVEVDAVATGGHKVTDLLKRVDQDVLSKKPTLVVIQIGVNDASAGVTPEMFKAQLTELIGKLQGGGVRVMQCTCTCRSEGYSSENAMDQKLDALAAVARNLAREKQLPLVDLRKAFIDYWKINNPENKPKGYLTYDGNHWTETGHRYVADQMLKKFK